MPHPRKFVSTEQAMAGRFVRAEYNEEGKITAFVYNVVSDGVPLYEMYPERTVIHETPLDPSELPAPDDIVIEFPSHVVWLPEEQFFAHYEQTDDRLLTE